MNSDFVELLSLFNQYKVRYLVVGGYAVMYHTEPRYTKDIDLYISGEKEDIDRFADAMNAFGFPLTEQNKADFTLPNQMIVIGNPPNRIDFLNDLGGLDFEEVWNKKIMVEANGFHIAYIDLESLIQAKKVAGRPKDKIDLKLLNRVKKARQKKE